MNIKQHRTREFSDLRSCVKVEWPSWAPVPNRPYVSVNVKQPQKKKEQDEFRALELRESRDGCLGSPSLTVLIVSVDAKQH